MRAIKQKYIRHINNCLSDLFYLGIQKYLMVEAFTSNVITLLLLILLLLLLLLLSLFQVGAK